jgi:hypothetical protein
MNSRRGLSARPARCAKQRDAYHQRPQAELKPAAFAFRQVGFGRLSLQGRIFPGRGKTVQGGSGAEWQEARSSAVNLTARQRLLEITHSGVADFGPR